MALGPDPYSVLGVSRDATSEQIARARHDLVLRYHPDVNHDPAAAERFDEVQQAFHLLSDPAARAGYDRARDGQGRARAAGSGAAASAVSGVLVQPATVEFGRLVPGNLPVHRKVAVTWTGAPPGRITSNPGGEWWTNLRMTRLASSGVVFYLSAQAPARAPNGNRHAELTVTLDDVVVTAPLTASIARGPAPDPPPAFEPGGFIRPYPPIRRYPPRTLWIAGGVLLLWVLVLVLSLVALGRRPRAGAPPGRWRVRYVRAGRQARDRVRWLTGSWHVRHMARDNGLGTLPLVPVVISWGNVGGIGGAYCSASREPGGRVCCR